MSDDRWADEWERFGRTDPYYAVCNLDENRGITLSREAAAAFWTSGETEIAATAGLVERLSGRPFAPRRALDFGCGVGRLTIPLARRSAHMVAVDVSAAMLETAQANAETASLQNIRFASSDAELAEVHGTFDFVHSFIVFQHIPPSLGYRLFARILEKLEPGGFGALHVTYHRQASIIRRIVHAVRRGSRVANLVANVLQGHAARSPMMPMFEYDMKVIARLLREADCGDPHRVLTDHGGHLGVMLFFQKGRTSVGRCMRVTTEDRIEFEPS